jgi:hypothetical protein
LSRVIQLVQQQQMLAQGHWLRQAVAEIPVGCIPRKGASCPRRCEPRSPPYREMQHGGPGRSAPPRTCPSPACAAGPQSPCRCPVQPDQLTVDCMRS